MIHRHFVFITTVLTIAVVTAFLLGSCATRSADIMPAYISPVTYAGFTCKGLAQEA